MVAVRGEERVGVRETAFLEGDEIRYVEDADDGRARRGEAIEVVVLIRVVYSSCSCWKSTLSSSYSSSVTKPSEDGVSMPCRELVDCEGVFSM